MTFNQLTFNNLSPCLPVQSTVVLQARTCDKEAIAPRRKAIAICNEDINERGEVQQAEIRRALPAWLGAAESTFDT